MWYAVHFCIAWAEVKNANNIYMEEDVFLMEGESPEWISANIHLLKNEYMKNNCKYTKKKTKNIFFGPRLIVEISNQDGEELYPPGNGDEITYEVLKFSKHKHFLNYINEISVKAVFYQGPDKKFKV